MMPDAREVDLELLFDGGEEDEGKAGDGQEGEDGPEGGSGGEGGGVAVGRCYISTM